MLRQRVNGYDMAHIDIGGGEPLVCIHGSLGDFRTWCPVLGPLSQRHRVIVPSLRRCFPEHWDVTGGGFTIARHLPVVLRALAAHVPDAKVEIIPQATHAMFEQDPVGFSRAVLEFLRSA
nr:hypothetical protein [uncultured Rhodopila sp.]